MKVILRIFMYLSVPALTASCMDLWQDDGALDFEAYDYENHDPAKVRMLEEKLKKHDMSLEAKSDEIRLEKSIRFPVVR